MTLLVCKLDRREKEGKEGIEGRKDGEKEGRRKGRKKKRRIKRKGGRRGKDGGMGEGDRKGGEGTLERGQRLSPVQSLTSFNPAGMSHTPEVYSPFSKLNCLPPGSPSDPAPPWPAQPADAAAVLVCVVVPFLSFAICQ